MATRRRCRPQLEPLGGRITPAVSYVDLAYGVGGVAAVPGLASVADFAALADGSVVVAGRVGATGGAADFGVARLTPAGRPDPAFGVNGLAVVPFDLLGAGQGDDFPVALAHLPDGGVVVLGTAAAPATPAFVFGPRRVAVAKLTAAGALDPTFDGDGRLVLTFAPNPTTSDTPLALGVKADGTLVVAGTAETDGSLQGFARRLTAAGATDPTYGAAGLGTLGAGTNAAAVDAAGRVLSVRRAPVPNEPPPTFQAVVTRLDAAGQSDGTYGTGGQAVAGPLAGSGLTRTSLGVRALADGSALLSYSSVGITIPIPSASLFKFGPAGAADATFANGFATTDGPSVRERQGGGLVGAALNELAVFGLTAGGVADPAFGAGGRIDTSALNFDPIAVAPTPGGSAVFAVTLGTTPRVVRLLPAGNQVPMLTGVPAAVTIHAGASSTVAFTVNDLDQAAGSLKVGAVADDGVLLPPSAVALGGSGASRTLTLTPALGRAGTTTVTVTVTDAFGATATAAVAVTVALLPPTLTGLPAAVAIPAGGGRTLTFTVGDPVQSADGLAVTAVADDGTLLPTSGVALGGSGANRTLTLTPAFGRSGATSVRLAVTNSNGVTTTTAIPVAVTPLPAALGGGTRFAVGPGAGGVPVVGMYGPGGQAVRTTSVFQAGFTGGVRVASADFTGDGVADLAVGTGLGSASRVEVYDGVTFQRIFATDPFEATFTGGVFVAAGDLTGDGRADLVVTPDGGGGPRVRVFDGATFAPIADFFGIADPAFRGGARATVGDVNGDGRADLVVAAGAGGGPRVAVFDGKTVAGDALARLTPDFFAFEPTLRNGAFVAAGDVDGDGFADVVAGGGPGGGPRVTVFSGNQLLGNRRVTLADFFAGDPAGRGGVRVAVKDLDGDSRADLVTGAGDGAGARTAGYSGRTLAPGPTPPAAFALDPFAAVPGGVYVG